MKLDPDAARVLEALAARPSLDSMTPAQAREVYAAGRAASVGAPTPVEVVRDITLPGPAGAIPARLYRPAPESAGPLPALVFFHGGGWVIGDLESHDGLCRRLAAGSGCTVIAIDYRMGPEHRFPAAVEDAEAAARAVHAQAAELGVDPGRLAVGGDSAGGNLAAVVTQAFRDKGGPALRWQMLIYPATDFAMDTPSQAEFAEGHFLTGPLQRWFHSHYLDEADKADVRASPARAETLAGLPPAFVLTASHDPLRDEGEAYAARLVAEGVRVETWRVPGQIHGFMPLDAMIAAAPKAAALLARRMREELTA
ncbi:alpha/beta hydrolase [Albimonas sp. CAU 1670]|uniref:alpha/beta hydrolase n=1 Tax=Albimonas sp. CAU 1670 TaxID=3032599 RepID=UPI0023DAEB28|nr:alpha/beta hydrolase [Albimonas sp. CAU 1670]MDF2234584.1 alpha/beta hydrolase [Albimonas sp. CAU 1670]